MKHIKRFCAILGRFSSDCDRIWAGSEQFGTIWSGSVPFWVRWSGVWVRLCLIWWLGDATVNLPNLPLPLALPLRLLNDALPRQITYLYEISQLPFPFPLGSGNYPKVVITTVLPVNGAQLCLSCFTLQYTLYETDSWVVSPCDRISKNSLN